MTPTFDYAAAFSRSIGWVTRAELQQLRARRVAIAGLGGVGGSHLLTLTRLGVGAFNLAELDIFGIENFNRQAGAALSTVGRCKLDVLVERARDINPELDLRLFPEGVTTENIDAFLADADLYLDGLDFFAVEARRQVFATCARLGIPAVTAAPLGMGAAVLNFLPGGMSFEEYFRLEGQPFEEQLVRFLLGLSPAMLQGGYLVDPTAVDLANHRGPSTPMACDLCAGLAATQVLKILLHRGAVVSAPSGLHFDAYRNELKRTWRPGGNRNPIQRLGLVIARRRFGRSPPPPAQAAEPALSTPIERILDLARWAPSGDNTQPWRFRLVDDHHFTVIGHDTRDWCAYDLDGRPSQLALGALLETIAVAASGEGLSATFERDPASPDTAPEIRVSLTPDPGSQPSPVLPFVRHRVTQRRPLATTPLTAREKAALEASVGPGYRVVWIEGSAGRWAMAKLLFRSARIRLTIREAYEVHRRIIEWDARYSIDRIPDQAVGLDGPTLKLMRWAMQSWERVRFLNTYLAGTLAPRLQLDFLPALRCGAHFVIVADRPLAGVDDWLAGGGALQRFWLTATCFGLQFQPEMTPLIFSRYALDGVRFSEDAAAVTAADGVRRDLAALLPKIDIPAAVFLGRLGQGPAPASRSIRKPPDSTK